MLSGIAYVTSCLFDSKSLHWSLWKKRFGPIWQLLTHKDYWIMNQMQKDLFCGVVDLNSISEDVCGRMVSQKNPETLNRLINWLIDSMISCCF